MLEWFRQLTSPDKTKTQWVIWWIAMFMLGVGLGLLMRYG